MTGVGLVVMIGACGVALLRRPAQPRRLAAVESEVRRPSGSWRWWTGVVMMVGLLAGSPVLGVVAVLGAGFGRREMGRRVAREEATNRRDAVLGFVSGVTTGLRAGRSLGVAVLESGGAGERPNTVAEDVAARVQAGRSLVQAVEEVLGSGAVDERLVATTIWALDGSGAPAGEALERVAEALRERRSSREDARTQAQQAMSSASVLSALPLVFGAMAALAEPDVGRLYASTWVGAGCVGAAGLLSFASWEWLQRLLGAV